MRHSCGCCAVSFLNFYWNFRLFLEQERRPSSVHSIREYFRWKIFQIFFGLKHPKIITPEGDLRLQVPLSSSFPLELFIDL